MAPLTDLLSCSIIGNRAFLICIISRTIKSWIDICYEISEKDHNGDVLWTWTYPSISEAQKTVVDRKCSLSSEHNPLQVFVCSRHKNVWFYIHCSEVFDSDKLPKVKLLFIECFEFC